eukprot:825012_1
MFQKFPQMFHKTDIASQKWICSASAFVSRGLYKHPFCFCFIVVDNKWIVPYNPGLLKALRCHVNVESVANVDCVKYIFKYVQKGSDRASVVLKDITNEPVDEIGIREDCRYICPYEACGNIYGFQQWHNYPKVERLPIIVDGQELAYWNESKPWMIDSAIEKK